MTPPWDLGSRWSPVWDAARLVLFVLIMCIPWMFLMGCGSVPLTTEYLDDVAAERARYVCMAARVPVEHLPYCIERGVNARQQSQIFGAWSPI